MASGPSVSPGMPSPVISQHRMQYEEEHWSAMGISTQKPATSSNRNGSRSTFPIFYHSSPLAWCRGQTSGLTTSGVGKLTRQKSLLWNSHKALLGALMGHIRNDATAVPIVRSVYYKWSVEHSSNMVVPYTGKRDRPGTDIATEMVR